MYPYEKELAKTYAKTTKAFQECGNSEKKREKGYHVMDCGSEAIGYPE